MLSDGPSSSLLVAGREQERARLRELLRAALDGRGSLVLLSGEAGIGKTTLVEELGQAARDSGAQVLTGHSYDLAATRPYAPWLEILSAYSISDATAPAPSPLTASDDRAAYGQEGPFEQVAEFFAAAAREAPLVIALEDLHWSDHASLDALRYLARQAATTALLIIVTYRDDELDPRHPLYRLVPVLVREAQAERIELRPLNDETMRAWMSQRYPLSPRDQERLVRHLQASAEGNPFYAVELLRTLESDSVLRPTLAGWTVGELPPLAVPLLLRQVIEARLEPLRDEERELLAVAAVIGPTTRLDIWSTVTGVDEARLVDTIEAAVNSNVLDASGDGRSVRFTHALIRAAIYEAILPPRRRALHSQIAETLLAGDAAEPDLVAHHLQHGDDPRAPHWLIRAGDRAYYSYAFSSAIERYEAALERLDPDDLGPDERAWTLLHLAQSHRYTNPHRALAYVSEAQDLAGALGDPILIAVTAWSRGQIRGLLGDNSLSELRGAFERLAALSASDRERLWERERLDYDVLTGAMTRWLALYGRYEESVRIGEAHVDTRPEAEGAWSGLGIAYAALGRPADAHRAFRRAFAFYERYAMRQLAQVVAFTDLTWVTLIYEADRVEERGRQAREAQAVWVRAASIRLDLDPRAVRASLDLIEGRWDDVERHANQMISPAFQTTGLNLLGQVARFRGEWDAARELVHAALPDEPHAEPAEAVRPSFISMLALIDLAANLALDQGDAERAARWVEMHTHWLTWSGAVLGRAGNELLQARLKLATADRDAAQRHAERALELSSDPRQPLTLLAAHRLLGEIAVDAQRYAAAAAHIDAALVLSAACAAPYERALTLLAHANLLAALARLKEARAALDEARALCEPLAARPALERAEALEERLLAQPRSSSRIAGLTDREIEVLRLVAQGLTDAEAGEQLFISPRTVSQHLRSVYNKLGVNSRAAAVAFLVEHGLA